MTSWLANPLWVLMWKHFRERRRRFGLTIWELTSGILFFIVLVLLKHCLREDVTNLASEIKKSNDYNTLKVLTSPDTGTFRSLMAKVCMNPQLSNKQYNFYCTFVKNQSEELEFRNDKILLQPTVTVLFQYVQVTNTTDLPHTLNYTIVYNGPKGDLRFKSLYTEDFTVYPDHHLDFLGDFQWTIDKTYMEEITGTNITHRLSYRTTIDQEPPELVVVYNLLIICSVLAPLPFFLYTTSRILMDKKTGLIELMKMSGVSASRQRASQVLQAIVFGGTYACLVTAILKIGGVLRHTHFIIVTITITMHFWTVVGLSFITSTLSQDSQHTDSLALLVYLSLFLINIVWYSKRKTSLFITYLVGAFLPHAPLYMFWDEITFMEQTGQEVSIYNVWYEGRHTRKDDMNLKCVSVIIVWTFFMIQLFLLHHIAWYMDLVRPGHYGIAARWYFFCRRKFWNCKKKKRKNFYATIGKGVKSIESQKQVGKAAEGQKQVKPAKDYRFFENGPKRASISIKIIKVRKIFEGPTKARPIVALDGVSLDVYRGLITVLLGINGAGKTTLLSIVTGMFSATKGKVYINGYDNKARLEEVKRDMCFCPQRNLTFDYLTVRENIVFFESLKGSKISHARINAESLMTKLDIHDKADNYNYQLPDSIKRSLQVACALAGDAEVLVLDEPTTGMDDKRRHALWDLLLVLRGEKTILLATSDTEEAYALADRIALLNHGRLMCHGSPAFLRNAIGTDFNLSITFKNKSINESLLRQTIGDTMESVHIDTHRNWNESVSLSLPAKNRDMLSKVFKDLEVNKSELGIETIKVGLSIEEVFLRFIEEDKDTNEICAEFQSDSNEPRLRGVRLMCQQMRVLIWRAFMFTWFRKAQFIVLQVLIPILGLLTITLATNTVKDEIQWYNSPDVNKQIMFSYPADNTVIKRSGVMGKLWEMSGNPVLRTGDVARDINNSLHPANHELEYIIGFDIHTNETNIYLPVINHYTVIESVNLFSNLFMTLRMPYVQNYSINGVTTGKYMRHNPRMTQFWKKDKSAKNLYLCLGWSMWIPFMIVITLCPFVMLPMHERQTGTRTSHLVTGCPPSILWYSKLLTHTAVYLIVVLPALLLIVRYLDADNTFNQKPFLYALTIILMAFGPAFLMHLYVMSFILNKNRAQAEIYTISLCFCLVTPVFLFFLADLANLAKILPILYIPITILDVVAHFDPVFTFTIALIRITILARSNAICKANRQLCPDGIEDDISFSKKICCSSSEATPYKYLSFSHGSSGIKELFYFFIQFVFYNTILILLQNRVLQTKLDRIINSKYKEQGAIYNDNKVLDEAEYVREVFREVKSKNAADGKLAISSRSSRTEDDVLLVKNVHKSYAQFKRCRIKRYPAVAGVSFSVKRGECLVILGQNGSGKSTMLDMLCGFTVMTRGNAWLDGCFINKHRKLYQRNVTWLGASTGLDGFLSGHDNLVLLGQLYGLSRHDAQNKADNCLSYMGLQFNSGSIVSSYSPGCLRRLGICRSLLGAPLLALLDEPLAGVDPRAAPLIGRAVRTLRQHTTCVCAVEGMDWHQLESLASRVAIMSRGQLIALGTVDDVKSLLGIGYNVAVKLKVDSAYRMAYDDDEDDKMSVMSAYSVKLPAPLSGLQHLKTDFHELFPSSKLTDEHLSALYFYIRDDDGIMRYSDMFMNLEGLKAKHSDLMDDYTLTATTVEQALYALEKRLL